MIKVLLKYEKWERGIVAPKPSVGDVVRYSCDEWGHFHLWTIEAIIIDADTGTVEAGVAVAKGSDLSSHPMDADDAMEATGWEKRR